MKKIAFSIVTILLTLIVACDKVKNPIVVSNTVVGTKFVEKNNSEVSNFKKALLEDYTGMRCQNCPRAARTASGLVNQNPNGLIVIAIHAGSLSEPFGSKFKSDFRTNSGDKWNGNSGFSIPSYPNGMINRKNYSSNGLVISDTKWSTVFEIAKNDLMVVKLDVTTKYDTTVSSLNIIVKATFKRNYSNNILLSAVVVEDGIVGWQTDGNEDVPDYEFEHMVRGTLNGDWGQQLNNKPIININDTVTYSIKDFDLANGLKYEIPNIDPLKPPTVKPIKVNDKKAYVVVFAYDALTKEVLQAEKVKIR